MISKKKWAKINRLKKRRDILENNIQRIESAIDKINHKLLILILRKK